MNNGSAIKEVRARVFVVTEDPPPNGGFDDLLDYGGHEQIMMLVSKQPRWDNQVFAWIGLCDGTKKHTALIMITNEQALTLLTGMVPDDTTRVATAILRGVE